MTLVEKHLLPVLACFLVAGLAPFTPAQDWPHWRGPDYNGSSSAKQLPASFDRQKSVRWSVALPGPGASTPIVVGDRIFLTAVDEQRSRLVALGIDRKSGKLLWSRDAGSGYGAREGRARVSKDRMSNYASPSAATDGERVVFFFGNGDMVAYDFTGKELWRRNIQKDYGNFAFQWTFSASPTILDGRVYMPVLQRNVPPRRGRWGRRGRRRGRRGRPPAPDRQAPQEQASKDERKDIESFILALDVKTGKTVFKHVRPSPARMESLESYTTMIPATGKAGRQELLLAGGDVLTGHDPATGRELWRWGTWNPDHRERSWRLVPSVVTGGGVAVVCAPKRAPAYAVRLGGEGNLDAKALAWRSEGPRNPVTSDVPTPAFHDGHLFVLSDMRNAISKVAATDGKVLWTTTLSRNYRWRASPTVADGRVFCMNHGGEVVVIDAGNGKIVHQAGMGDEGEEQARASIVAAHGALFIRTSTRLFCLGG